MKKVFISALIVIGVIVGISRQAGAQDFNFDRAYQDYVYNLGIYQSSYSDYEKARDFYLTNQTLTLKEEARQKTLSMLRARDQLQTVYLTALRIKIVEIKGLSGDEKGGIFGKIDSEVAWYKEHKGKYGDSDSLENLFDKSSEAEGKYKESTSRIVYEALFIISLGEEKSLRESHEEIYSTIRSMTPDPFNRWFSDIDSVIQKLKDNESVAKTQIQKVYSDTFSIEGSYNTSIGTLASSLTLLSQLNNFLTELATSIKNQL